MAAAIVRNSGTPASVILSLKRPARNRRDPASRTAKGLRSIAHASMPRPRRTSREVAAKSRTRTTDAGQLRLS